MSDDIQEQINSDSIGEACNPITMLAKFSPRDEEWRANTDAIQWEILKQLKRIADQLEAGLPK